MTKWQMGVGATVASAVILGAGGICGSFLLTHFAVAGEMPEKISALETSAISTTKAVDALLERAEKEDAAAAETAKHCRTGVIQDAATCNAVGEKVVE